MGSPLISVLMPVYNCQAYVAEAIECIRAQTLDDWELIIVDDGSRDDSFGIMESMASRDRRLRTVRQENGGVGAALNTALEMASGKYLARMDADDRTPPARFAEQIHFLEQEPEITVVGGWHRYFGAAESRVYEFPTERNHLKAVMMFRNPISHPTVMMRRQAFVENGWRYSTRRKFPEDYDLWVTIAQRHELANIPKVYLDYRVWPGSVCQDPQLRWRNEMLQTQFRVLARLGLTPNERQRSLHEALAFEEIRAETKFIADAHAWLLEIYQADQRQPALNAQGLARALTGRYIALVRTAARCGAEVAGLADSPFRRYVEIPLP